MKKAFLFYTCSFGLLFLCFNLFLGFENKNFLFPHIDTRFPKDFSFDKWDRVRRDMTKDTVIQILGKPLAERKEKFSPFRPPCAAYEMCYSSDGAWGYTDFAWESFYIFLDSNNVVIAKSREWMHD
jgi:hypothetical protein